MKFTKMQGLGNDYLYVWGPPPPDAAALSVRLSDRHFGPGADGMIFIEPSEAADFRMRIFNADGSEARMCGNGIRCVGKYVYEKGYTEKTALVIETLAGPRSLALRVAAGKVAAVTVDMGVARVSPELVLPLRGVPNAFRGAEGVSCRGGSPEPPAPPAVGGRGERAAEGGGPSMRDGSLGERAGALRLTPVDVGNPHAVVFVEDLDAAAPEVLGPRIERHPLFPGGVNAEFVQALDAATLRMRVWERGSGVTLACGTGACASAAAAVARGLCAAGTPVTVRLDGGPLSVTVGAEGRVSMTGPCEFVCEGDTEIC